MRRSTTFSIVPALSLVAMGLVSTIAGAKPVILDLREAFNQVNGPYTPLGMETTAEHTTPTGEFERVGDGSQIAGTRGIGQAEQRKAWERNSLGFAGFEARTNTTANVNLISWEDPDRYAELDGIVWDDIHKGWTLLANNDGAKVNGERAGIYNLSDPVGPSENKSVASSAYVITTPVRYMKIRSNNASGAMRHQYEVNYAALSKSGGKYRYSYDENTIKTMSTSNVPIPAPSPIALLILGLPLLQVARGIPRSPAWQRRQSR